ncbi:YcfL family protein [Histophilus somni]|uniref:YcfL family protein n=1 Tax=Histophilus somni TaxID=731 RepID=UPI00109CEB28|nr:YcfL family protein [Histophilus somni]QEH17666.1 DUF1425 domain-containing protein [Histophilus somni]THA22255.1 DUF1425 domain-containing protein [Histophilus somni]
MKNLLIAVILSLGLIACSSSKKVNLVHSQQPIINISTELASDIDVQVSHSSASLTNVSQKQVTLVYYFFWYDKNGVTQGDVTNMKNATMLILSPGQTRQLVLQKPTTESVNYRLYLSL